MNQTIFSRFTLFLFFRIEESPPSIKERKYRVSSTDIDRNPVKLHSITPSLDYLLNEGVTVMISIYFSWELKVLWSIITRWSHTLSSRYMSSGKQKHLTLARKQPMNPLFSSLNKLLRTILIYTSRQVIVLRKSSPSFFLSHQFTNFTKLLISFLT
jgi:hypothetical protein